MLLKILFAVTVIFNSCLHHIPEKPEEERVTISTFTRAEDYRLIDTLTTKTISEFLSKERVIAGDSVPQLVKMLDEIKANGTDDVTKCFIPHHAITFYKKGTIDKYVLICFLCDGLRFSNEHGTPCKDEYARERQMKALAAFIGSK